MRICVVGGGRMGLPLACVFAKHGASVTVADVNEGLVALLNGGRCPYEEPGLDALITDLHRAGRLSATTHTSNAVSEADAVVVIVPAHLTPERDIDFRILESASHDVGLGLRRGTLVVYETTVSIGGTRRHLIPALEAASGLTAGVDFSVAYSPERVKANVVLSRLQDTPKVVGGLDEESRRRAVVLYSEYLKAPVDDVGSLEAAESTKLLGMLYRDVNIALANELAAFCEIAGIDFDRVRSAANTDGEANLLMAGIGVGGHCTPVYPYFLTRESRRLGMTQRISEAAREINDYQPARQLDRLAACWRPLSGLRVHILGLGFRPGVKVPASSPAFALRDRLFEVGARPTLEDPHFSASEIAAHGFTPGEANGSHAIVLNTAHPQFAQLDFSSLRESGVEAALDGRNFWSREDVETAGILYLGIGRSAANERARCGPSS